MSLFSRSCLALALLLTTARHGFAQSNPPCGTFLTKWGSQGGGEGQFEYPSDVAVDGSGNVLVADLLNHRIQKFSNTGAFLTMWGSVGSGDGQLAYPWGVAVDGSGNVFVADTGNRRIQKFTSDGTFLTKWGSDGSGNGQFTHLGDIAVDGSGQVFATDWAEQCFPFGGCEVISARIQKFSDTGTFLTTWGSPGNEDGQFNTPYRVAVDGSGNVYVADDGNARIQKFTNTGSFILKWGSYGSGNGQFTFPFAIAVDGNGHVFVTDTDNNLTNTPARIEEFTNTGTFLTTWGSPGTGDGQFGNGGPNGVAVDGSGHVFVADGNNNRIQKFTCPCGNGQVDPGEQCDDGNSVNGDCCSSTCQFEPLNSSCNDHNPCTSGDRCTGTGVCGFTSCSTGMACIGCGLQCTWNGSVCKCGGPDPCTAGGQSVGGVCWYEGSVGESCDQTCAAVGKTCDPATITYAGSAGTTAHCDAVLAALNNHAPDGRTGDLDCTLLTAPGVGCWWFFIDYTGTAIVYARCTTPPTTCDAVPVFGGGPASGSRACACS